MEAKELKLLAAGRWASIVTSLAPHLGSGSRAHAESCAVPRAWRDRWIPAVSGF